jgi:hypothetical protein
MGAPIAKAGYRTQKVQYCAENIESKESLEESLGSHSISTCLIGSILRDYAAKELSGWDVGLALLGQKGVIATFATMLSKRSPGHRRPLSRATSDPSFA